MGERDQLRERIRELRAPEEEEARRRSWEVIRDDFEARQLTRPPRPAGSRGRRLALALLALAIGAGAVLSPAGAEVRDWVGEVIDPGVENARPALTAIPGGGELLVDSPGGSWAVAADGSRRRLGAFAETGWSPGGLFVVAARGRSLSALEPDGTARWSISRAGKISSPRWSPTGFRIAYRSGAQLRVIAGDGTGDRRLAAATAPLAAAWRPLRPDADPLTAANVIAYLEGDRRLVVRDVDSGRELWSRRVGEAPLQLHWLDPERLAAVTASGAILLAAGGEPAGRISVRGRVVDADGAGGRLALVTRDQSGSAAVSLRAPGRRQPRELFSGPVPIDGVTLSPAGDRLLVEWRGADQWIFVRTSGARGVVAFDRISREFDPGGRGGAGFPTVRGWCCRG